MAGNKNILHPFEQQLKETLDQYEVPFNSADWDQMDRALSSGVQGWGRGHTFLLGLLVAGGLLIGGTAYYIGSKAGSETTQVAAMEQQAQAPEKSTEHATGQGQGVFAEPEATPSTPSAVADGHGHAMELDRQHLAGEQPTESSARSGERGAAEQQASSSTPNMTAISDGEGPRQMAEAASTAGFKASMKEACPGSVVDFKVEDMPTDGIYLWNFGDGSFSNKANPQHTFTKPGLYQVTLSISTTSGGTIRSTPHSDRIAIHEAPQAGFNIVSVTPPGQIPAVRFVDRAQAAKRYHWDFGDGTTSTEAQPSHVYRKAGVYQVVQTVENEIGCIDRQVKELRIERGFDLDAPKSLNPNDTGKDAYFMPQDLRGINAAFQLNIYDTDGNLLYKTSNANHPWTGRLDNKGPVLPAGNYVWVADVETGHGTESFTGTVALLK